MPVSARPLILDLFCGGGGAAMGYHRAGFDVIGVDINPQPRYPFQFIQADALEFLVDLNTAPIAAIHASPPCKLFTKLSVLHDVDHPNLLAPTRDLLQDLDVPWVIENVPGAPLRPDFVLCGCMFGLPRLRRQRWFETNWCGLQMQSPCHHGDTAVTVAGHPGGWSTRDQVQRPNLVDWKQAMGIDWMSARELSQAIPPAYTQLIGEQLLDHLEIGCQCPLRDETDAHDWGCSWSTAAAR